MHLCRSHRLFAFGEHSSCGVRKPRSRGGSDIAEAVESRHDGDTCDFYYHGALVELDRANEGSSFNLGNDAKHDFDWILSRNRMLGSTDDVRLDCSLVFL